MHRTLAHQFKRLSFPKGAPTSGIFSSHGTDEASKPAGGGSIPNNMPVLAIGTIDWPVRCVKSCRPNDIPCLSDLIQSISHTVISLPIFRDFVRPEEIVFLRTTSPAYSSLRPGSHTMIFDILEGNVQNSFDIVKRYEHGMTVGVVRQVKPIAGPLYTVLKLAVNHVASGVVSYRNIINIHIFVSEFWF